MTVPRFDAVFADRQSTCITPIMIFRSSLLFLVACAANHPAPEPTLELSLGTTHAGRTRRITPLPEARPTISIETAQRLLSATNELAHAEPENEHERLVYGFERLADALDEVTDSGTIEDVRRSAADLERDSRWNARADVARSGFEDAARVLAQIEPASNDHARRALETSSRATASIDPKRAVAAQCETIGIAFRETVRALFAASGSTDLEFADLNR